METKVNKEQLEEKRVILKGIPSAERVHPKLIRLGNGKYILPPNLKYSNGVYYDFDTTNTSFLVCCKDLKNAGVKYNYFMLALYDPELYGVDPFDPTLDDYMIQKILTECYRNPWYYLRECGRIPVSGGKSVPFRLNRAMCAVIWLFLMGIDTYVTIARQIGKTTAVVAILLWVYIFGNSNSQFLFLHIDKPRASKNLQDLKLQMDCLPSYMQQYQKIDYETGRTIKGKNNVNSMENAFNGNSIITKGQPDNAENAANLGRGLSQPIQFFDEFEFIRFNDEILSVAGPSFVTISQTSKANNAIYGRIFSSTAGNLDTNAGQAAMKLWNERIDWYEGMYDEYFKHGESYLKEIIKRKSSVKVVYIEYPYYLLGKDDAWYYAMASSINDKMRFRREILLQRLHGSSESPYDQEDLDAIYNLRRKPIETHVIFGGYTLEIYKKINPKNVYFLGIDVSDGYGQDSTVIVATDPYNDNEVVATLASPFMPTHEQPKVITFLASKYFRRGPINIERNKATALLDTLMNTPLKNRIYYTSNAEDTEGKEVMDRKGHLVRQAQIRKGYGIITSTKTRPKMFELLEYYVRDFKHAFVSEQLIHELQSLIVKNGVIKARQGEHDDYIMAFLMNLYVYHYGKRLYMYGFQKGKPQSASTNEYNYTNMTKEERDIHYNQLPEEIKMQFPKPQDLGDYKRKEYGKYLQAKKQYAGKYNAGGNDDDDVFNETDINIRLNEDITGDNINMQGFNMPSGFMNSMYDKDDEE